LAPLARGQDSGAIERDLNAPIVVGVSENSYPYSFKDNDGQLKGFSVDLLDAVSREMNLHLRRVPVMGAQMADALQSKQIDVVQFWAETTERRSWAAFSVPILRLEMVCVVRDTEKRIKTLADLKGMRVAIGQKGTAAEYYLIQKHPDANCVYAETNADYLKALARGEVDAAVLARITAVSAMEKYGLKNLRVLDDKIQGFDIRQCLAVRGDDGLLLARLNEGLAIIHRKGIYDEIYRKWFGRFESRSFSSLEVLSYVTLALALALGVALWAFLKQRALSNRISRQTVEIVEQKSLLSALYDRLPMAALVLELNEETDSRIVSLNLRAAELLCIPPSSSGSMLGDINLSMRWRAFMADVAKRRQKQQDAISWEVRLAETHQLVSVTTVPLGGDKDGFRRFCVLFSDITKQRLNDEELHQSRRQRALGELVGGIAHEFNNLLTPVMATASIIQIDHPHDKALQQDLATITKAATNAAALTRRLLAFGRKGDEGAELIRVENLVETCFGLVRPSMDRRIELFSSIPTQLPPLFFNATDLTQILFNLIINSRDTLLEKIAQKGLSDWAPTIRVTAIDLPQNYFHPFPGSSGKVIEAWQQISVEDNGMGIDPNIIDRIFEPFFTTKEVGKGTGLGLATVWHLVTDVGGSVTVESKLGEGTKIHVNIPRWKQPSPSFPERKEQKTIVQPQTGGKLLLVEDEELVARSVMPVLLRLGYEVVSCADGAEAWSRFADVGMGCKVILIDLNMPRMNGIDFVRHVRTTPYPGAILVMSGRVSDEDMLSLQELNINGILNKPFTSENLTDSIRRAIT
jgi:signal transduction histidine kinase/CheY-like chemotaxis protein